MIEANSNQINLSIISFASKKGKINKRAIKIDKKKRRRASGWIESYSRG